MYNAAAKAIKGAKPQSNSCARRIIFPRSNGVAGGRKFVHTISLPRPIDDGMNNISSIQSGESKHNDDVASSLPEFRHKTTLPCTINPIVPRNQTEINVIDNHNQHTASLPSTGEQGKTSKSMLSMAMESSGVTPSSGQKQPSTIAEEPLRTETSPSAPTVHFDSQLAGNAAVDSGATVRQHASPSRRSIILPIDPAHPESVNEPPLTSTKKSSAESKASSVSASTQPNHSKKPVAPILRKPKLARGQSATPSAAANQSAGKFGASPHRDIPRAASHGAFWSSGMQQRQQQQPFPLPAMPMGKPMRRSVSEPPARSFKAISFDPRIWVREFERSEEEQEGLWYSTDDLETFRRHAVALVLAREKLKRTEYLPTGTGRIVPRHPTTLTKGLKPNTMSFTHSALSVDEKEDETTTQKALRSKTYMQLVLRYEVQNILLVDPQSICLTLFSKALQVLVPNAKFAMARSGEEALRHLATGKKFDIVLVEEHLKLFSEAHGARTLMGLPNEKNAGDITDPSQRQGRSWEFVSGSSLIRTISKLGSGNDGMVFIGVSAHVDKDRKRLENSGADFVWGKPPPRMNNDVLKSILKKILIKRKKQEVAGDLFGI